MEFLLLRLSIHFAKIKVWVSFKKRTPLYTVLYEHSDIKALDEKGERQPFPGNSLYFSQILPLHGTHLFPLLFLRLNALFKPFLRFYLLVFRWALRDDSQRGRRTAQSVEFGKETPARTIWSLGVGRREF